MYFAYYHPLFSLYEISTLHSCIRDFRPRPLISLLLFLGTRWWCDFPSMALVAQIRFRHWKNFLNVRAVNGMACVTPDYRVHCRILFLFLQWMGEFNFAMATLAQGIGFLVEQTLVFAAVGLVAREAVPRSHGRMLIKPRQLFLHAFVARGADNLKFVSHKRLAA